MFCRCFCWLLVHRCRTSNEPLVWFVWLVDTGSNSDKQYPLSGSRIHCGITTKLVTGFQASPHDHMDLINQSPPPFPLTERGNGSAAERHLSQQAQHPKGKRRPLLMNQWPSQPVRNCASGLEGHSPLSPAYYGLSAIEKDEVTHTTSSKHAWYPSVQTFPVSSATPHMTAMIGTAVSAGARFCGLGWPRKMMEHSLQGGAQTRHWGAEWQPATYCAGA